MNDVNRSYARERLYLTTLALSLSGREQIDLFGDEPWIQRGNELANEFDISLDIFRRWYPDTSRNALAPIEAIDSFLSAMTDRREEGLWSDDAILVRQEWEHLRLLAKRALESNPIDWPDVPPSRLENIFGPRRRLPSQ